MKDRSHRENPQPSKFKTKPVKALDKLPNESVDSNGREIDKNSYLCVAKRYQNRYYIRRATTGIFRVYNPLEDDKKELDSKLSDTGRDRWEFFAVPEDCYTLYIKFLETQNPVYLRNCERLAI